MVQRTDYASRMFSWMPEMNMWVVLLIVIAIVRPLRESLRKIFFIG